MIFIYLLAACRVFFFFGIVLNTELGGSHTLKTTTVALLSHIGASIFYQNRWEEKYYNSKLDDSPTTVSHVTANNSSQIGSVIR